MDQYISKSQHNGPSFVTRHGLTSTFPLPKLDFLSGKVA